MANEKKTRRYVVSDIGFAYAVHDTQARQDYEFEAGKEKDHISTNELNTRRVDIFPTFLEAIRAAEELNRRHEQRVG